MKSTHNNNELTIKNVNEKVKLRGWVSKVRDLGGLLFIDLRDREGITQIVVRPENKFYDAAVTLRNEFVIYIEGTVIERESKNDKLKTGEIEVDVELLEILNSALTTPMIIADETDALEDTRMKYRYLDLRRPEAYSFIKLRSDITHIIRDYFNKLGFCDVETPMLGKSTPEGARDYLVPSRLYQGKFYALPQSPQLYKQLLMVGGIEKYYQIVKCFRDEDLRADRQPEFTQVDIELSFATQEDIIAMTNDLFKRLFKEVLNIEFGDNIPQITYQEAMDKYGSDKPDIRFEMHLNDITNTFTNSEFMVFKNTIANNNVIKCIVARNCADKYSRKNIEALEKQVKQYGAKGLAWMKYTENDFTGGISKFVTDEEKSTLINDLNLNDNDLVFIVADTYSVVSASLGFLRLQIARDEDLLDDNVYAPLWVVDWPLFEYDEELRRYFAAHHPFTAPKKEHQELLVNDPKNCLANAYDIVINGYEIGGGSLRIANQDMQSDMFKALGMSEEEAYNQFGFFIDALKYGTPPHGGIALGLDRIIMIFGKTNNIKDVIAFSKTQSAKCPMMDAPNDVSSDQLEELGLSINKES